MIYDTNTTTQNYFKIHSLFNFTKLAKSNTKVYHFKYSFNTINWVRFMT